MAKLPMLTTEQLTAAIDLKPVEFDVPELGGSILVKAFTIDERDTVMAAVTEKDGGKIDGNKLIRLLVVHGVVEPKFTTEIVSKMSFQVVEKIAQKVMELNGLQTDKKAAAADVVADVTFRQES